MRQLAWTWGLCGAGCVAEPTSAGGDSATDDGVPFTVVAEGETGPNEEDLEGVESCSDLHVAVSTDEDALAALYESTLYETELPTVDWSSSIAITSWITWCSSGLKTLSVSTVIPAGDDLELHEVLTSQKIQEEVISRPFNVIAIATRDVAGTAGTLTFERP